LASKTGQAKIKIKMENAKLQADYLSLGNFGWRYYNSVKKKAMEQEFSWSGLILSLSIAFFIVITSSVILGLAYKSLEKINFMGKLSPVKIYQMEGVNDYSVENYLQKEYLSKEKIEQIRILNLA